MAAAIVRGLRSLLKIVFVVLSPMLVFSSSAAVQAQEEGSGPLVLTALAPLFQLASPLLANTNIELQLVPEPARTMTAQVTLFTRQAERYMELFAQADAVLTTGKLWANDPFYTAVREVNIRVVNIDASKPWSHELDGVAVANAPSSGQVSPWFWLSLSNVIRMLDIMGSDLQRLYPEYAATIQTNVNEQKDLYAQMKNRFEQAFIAVDDPVVHALADEFVYLTRDLGIFVNDYFIKQDIDWTNDDLDRLEQTLQENGIRVVVHKWEPTAEIQQAVRSAGAALLVLDTLETTSDFRAGLQRNLDALLAAFNAAP